RGTAGVWSVLARTPRVSAEEAWLASAADEVLAFVGLAHRRDERAGALPYGEQRLVELAVALAARPRLLLLDEPAAGMTGAEKERLVALIRKIRGGDVTVLVVEHDMRLVMGLSETVIVLNHGRVIAEGVPAEIRAHPEVSRAYLGRARESRDGRVRASRRRRGGRRPRARVRSLPHPRRSPAAGGGNAVGRRAADAGHRPRADGPAPADHVRRAVARPRTHDRRDHV